MPTYIDKLAFVYLKDKKILMTLSHGKDTYYIPGGKREEGEDDIAALTREVLEELMVELIPETISKYGVFEAQAHGKPEGTIVRMTCYKAEFEGEPKASSEIAQVLYLTYQDKPKTSPVDQIIFDDLFRKNLLV